MARTSTKTSKVITTLPKTETGHGVLCKTASGQQYTISYNPDKEKFTLWRVCDEGYEKLSTANSLLNLYDVIPWQS